MLYLKHKELLNIEDIFENDELVLMRATYDAGTGKIIEISVGLKDENGDIIKIVDVDKKFCNTAHG